MTENSWSGSTLASSDDPGVRPRARVPCLTIACHPDLQRIGERALLTPLLVRGTVRLARGQLSFAQPGDDRWRPLADPYLTREPIELTIERAGELVIDHLPAKAKVDGVAVGTRCRLPAIRLEQGVQLQLSSRILLLLHATAAEPATQIDGILGHSDAIEHVRRQLLRAAMLDARVLIRGETGAGKEQAAFTVHARSARRDQAWVCVNMATLGEGTAAAALFGHARGAFTGAATRHHGLFEQAHRGTLFLDEVGDTPRSVQAMLLRVLETGEVHAVGDERARRVDVRIVAATELPLESGTDDGGFRSALKHRLAGYEIVVPPLRERPDDIPRLFCHFLRSELRAMGREALIESEADNPEPPLRSPLVSALMREPFPGNVRELINLARRLAIAADETGKFAFEPSRTSTNGESGAQAAVPAGSDAPLDRPTRQPGSEADLLAALERNDFSPMRTAAELGVPPSTIHFWMRRAGIRRASDLTERELQDADAACRGDLSAMAAQLRVSERALRLALGRRGESGDAGEEP